MQLLLFYIAFHQYIFFFPSNLPFLSTVYSVIVAKHRKESTKKQALPLLFLTLLPRVHTETQQFVLQMNSGETKYQNKRAKHMMSNTLNMDTSPLSEYYSAAMCGRLIQKDNSNLQRLPHLACLLQDQCCFLQHFTSMRQGLHQRQRCQGACYISPHSLMTQASFGRLFGPVATFSIFRRTSRPSPSTLCNGEKKR